MNAFSNRVAIRKKLEWFNALPNEKKAKLLGSWLASTEEVKRTQQKWDASSSSARERWLLRHLGGSVANAATLREQNLCRIFIPEWRDIRWPELPILVSLRWESLPLDLRCYMAGTVDE